MKCEHVKELLSAYLDDMLAAEERQSVASHLQGCRECNAVLADFRHFDTLIAHLPRTAPDHSLHEKIFSSTEYKELTGTFDGAGSTTRSMPSSGRMRHPHPDRPHLVALPGGRQAGQETQSAAPSVPRQNREPLRRLQHHQGLSIMRVVIAAAILLTIGLGSFIGWHLWQKQDQAPRVQNTNTFTPPAGPQQGPIPAGVRFVFLRDGALWSVPSDGGSGTARLTPANTTVAENWTVRPALPGRLTGNMLAYIDLQQAQVHIIRSDGQNDSIIHQPLLKAGVAPETIWDTENGAAILSSLTWSKDGAMLAFVADPQGTGQLALYIYNLSSQDVHEVSLPLQGRVSHPVWSPDSIRIAFEFTHDGLVGILDYNTQNHGVLTITSAVNSQPHEGDTILSLNWSADSTLAAITWSVGTIGHVHGIWWQHVGIAGSPEPHALLKGDYVQATYSGNDGGKWLLVTEQAGLPGDVMTAGLNTGIITVTRNKQVTVAQWAPDGGSIDYLDTVVSGVGTLHIVNTTTGVDTLVATNVTSNPQPAWSTDGQRLVYSTGTHILISDVRAGKTSQPLTLQGPATALSWSVADVKGLVLATNDSKQGIYLVDTEHNTSLRLEQGNTQGPILWTQIP